MIISSFFKSRLKHDSQIRLLLLFNVLYTVLDVSSLEIPYYTLCWMLHLLKSLISLSHTLGLSPLGYMWFDLALVSCYRLKYDVNSCNTFFLLFQKIILIKLLSCFLDLSKMNMKSCVFFFKIIHKECFFASVILFMFSLTVVLF